MSGLSKYVGERFVLNGVQPRRGSQPGFFEGFPAKGRNFVDAILARARRSRRTQVTDIAMSPTSITDLAAKTWELIGRTRPAASITW